MPSPYLLTLSLSIVVLFGAICRLDVLMLSKHKFSWGAMYICYAAFASSCALKQYDEGYMFGLVACTLNLFLTKHLWDESPPPSTEK